MFGASATSVEDPMHDGVPPLAKPSGKPGPHDALIAAVLSTEDSAGNRPNKIRTIKALRQVARMGLSEAKFAVEDYGQRYGVAPLVPGKSGNELFVVAYSFIIVLLFGGIGGLIAARGPTFASIAITSPLTHLAAFGAGWYLALHSCSNAKKAS